MNGGGNNEENITEKNTWTQKSGNENGLSFLSETIGAVFIAGKKQHKCIIRNIQKEISEKSLYDGLYQYVNLVMNRFIVKWDQDKLPTIYSLKEEINNKWKGSA